MRGGDQTRRVTFSLIFNRLCLGVDCGNCLINETRLIYETQEATRYRIRHGYCLHVHEQPQGLLAFASSEANHCSVKAVNAIALLVILVSPGASASQEHLTGLLPLPEVFGDYPCQVSEGRAVKLLSGPSNRSPSVGVIEVLNPKKPTENPSCDPLQIVVRRAGASNAVRTEQLPTEEIGYEMPAAIVYERSRNWFRIALQTGSAWIERTADNGFKSYPQLLSDGGYVRKEWDGRFWTAPGMTSSMTRVPSQWTPYLAKSVPVEYLERRTIGGELWFHVRMDPAKDSCLALPESLPKIDGWLPAYLPSGKTALWFYSRGC